jgi:hypothetical protein
MGLLPEGAHNEEEVGHEADSVDAEGEGGDVLATCAESEATTLPGVEEVAHEDGKGRGGKDVGDDDLDRDATDGGDER